MRILIADDNERVRAGVAMLVSSNPDCIVCGQAKDGQEAVTMARELQPDVILIDVSMPILNGLDATRLIRAHVPNSNILVMSQHDPAMLLPRALEAGANACVDKSRLGTDLLAAIANLDLPDR
jgi:two-component system, NarL family, response regulator NreC